MTSDDVPCLKPAPDIFLKCAKLLNVAPEHCLVFEDTDFGIQAAKACNIKVIDVRITSIIEMRAYLNKHVTR